MLIGFKARGSSLGWFWSFLFEKVGWKSIETWQKIMPWLCRSIKDSIQQPEDWCQGLQIGYVDGLLGTGLLVGVILVIFIGLAWVKIHLNLAKNVCFFLLCWSLKVRDLFQQPEDWCQGLQISYANGLYGTGLLVVVILVIFIRRKIGWKSIKTWGKWCMFLSYSAEL